MVSIRRAYGLGPDGAHHLGGTQVVALAAAVSIGAWSARGWSGPVAGLAAGGSLAFGAWAVDRTRAPRHARVGGGTAGLLLIMALACLAGWRGEAARAGLEPRATGPFEGWVRIVDDPAPYGSATRVIVAVDGERFEMWARGRARRRRVGEWRAGERVRVHAERRALPVDRRERVAWQHVVGELEVDWVGDHDVGTPIDRASNRVRALIERGGDVLPRDDGSLFRGLVVGDDRDQPRAMIRRFRASGLSHLTAVSGQNVSFVLAAAGPLLAALRPWWRWAVTLGLIGWFVSLTRFEPSIVRAGAMAALSATGFVLGRERSPGRLLGLAVAGLVLVDPLLVGSVGFWLSVGATAGVASIGPWLSERLSGWGALAEPLGVTLGAQMGVVVPALAVFGRLPLVSVPANLLAVPVAGFVMLYGLPAGLLAGAVPGVAPVVMFPCRLGVRWVDTVAMLGERWEPGGRTTWVGWVALATAVGAWVLRGEIARRAAVGVDRPVAQRGGVGPGKNRSFHGRASPHR